MFGASKIIQLTVDRLGPKGDGVAIFPKGSVFVDRTAPLDEVSVRIFQDKAGITRGEVVKLLTPSPYRQKPPCPHFDSCGNCTLQHLNLEFYQFWKNETVKESLKKAGLHTKTFLKPIFLEGQNRRRITFTALNERGKITLGYYQRRSKQITTINQCEIALPDLFVFKDSLKPFLKYLLTPSTPIDISLQWVSGKLDIVISGLKLSAKNEKILKEISQLHPVARLSLKNETKINVLFNNHPLRKSFGEIQVNLPPGAFLQPTQEGEEALVKTVMAALPEGKQFADLFSGCGTFSGAMLSRGSVDSFESSNSAVKSLSEATRNFPLKVYRRDLFKNPIRHQDLNRFDAIVFDPPRAGCEEQAHEMALSKCKTLIGVSCNPATFARDAKILVRGGYQLQSLQVIDQFLWSHHVELVGVFKKPR